MYVILILDIGRNTCLTPYTSLKGGGAKLRDFAGIASKMKGTQLEGDSLMTPKKGYKVAEIKHFIKYFIFGSAPSWSPGAG